MTAVNSGTTIAATKTQYSALRIETMGSLRGYVEFDKKDGGHLLIDSCRRLIMLLGLLGVTMNADMFMKTR
jgi:hypothetical protein